MFLSLSLHVQSFLTSLILHGLMGNGQFTVHIKLANTRAGSLNMMSQDMLSAAKMVKNALAPGLRPEFRWGAAYNAPRTPRTNGRERREKGAGGGNGTGKDRRSGKQVRERRGKGKRRKRNIEGGLCPQLQLLDSTVFAKQFQTVKKQEEIGARGISFACGGNFRGRYFIT